jgi:hypothetical protein
LRAKTLAGDRGIEWGFAIENLPVVGTGKRVLDFGPMNGFQLSVDAVNKGYSVVAVGLEDIAVPHPDIRYIRRDIMAAEFDEPFDYILNVSTTEHVGLGRYGDPLDPDGDLKAMRRLKRWMRLNGDGIQIMTIPIGVDAVVGQYHRVYGPQRLPRLLKGFSILRERYWIKADDDSSWLSCTKERALAEIPGQVPEPSILYLSYALGGFVLCGA